jgi:small subunit ribosomal protein S9
MTTQQHYYYGTGKRKSAIAQVRLYPQGGAIVINGKSLDETFPWPNWQILVRQPFRVTETEGKFSANVKVYGGGVVAQANAIRHGIARALLKAEPSLKKSLREHGLLTRDSRVKESKKYGLKRARRAPQYTKR